MRSCNHRGDRHPLYPISGIDLLLLSLNQRSLTQSRSMSEEVVSGHRSYEWPGMLFMMNCRNIICSKYSISICISCAAVNIYVLELAEYLLVLELYVALIECVRGFSANTGILKVAVATELWTGTTIVWPLSVKVTDPSFTKKPPCSAGLLKEYCGLLTT